jgi:pimeloyl-ACP methyl ester carboxylesterase
LFSPTAASLELRSFGVISVRRAGYGSKLPKQRLTIKDHANHVKALIAVLRLEHGHHVGHSPGALICLEAAAISPNLVRSLTLIEPAACGPFRAPAIEPIGQRFVGPAMSAFAAGNLQASFHNFMQGICGDNYRTVFESTLGHPGVDKAIRDSSYFFSDEVPAAMLWHFGPAEASRIGQPVFIVEGGEGRTQGPLSQQKTELAQGLFPSADTILIERANHMLPLQRPDKLACPRTTALNQEPRSIKQTPI